MSYEFRIGNVRFQRTGAGNIEIRIDGRQPGWIEHADVPDLIGWLIGNGNGRALGRADTSEGETDS